MRIAVVNLTGGGLSNGYCKYLKQLVPLLRRDPSVTRLDLFVPPQATTYFSEPEVTPLLTWNFADPRLGYRGLKARLQQLAPDVVFIPTASWLPFNRVPTVVMVRNMEPLTVPFGGNSVSEGLKNLLRAYRARVACQHASRVIAVSRHVRDFLVTRWKIDTHKVGVVYHGIEPPPECTQVIRPPGLDSQSERFVFTAGSIRPARGLEDLVKAMAILSVREPGLALVIGGKTDPGTEFYKQRIVRLADELGVAHRMIWAGQLNAKEMSWCFYNCVAFVVTSRAEACPNTALEAMSHGCLIISTHQPPMPEFFVESAWYYQPQAVHTLAEKIRLALDVLPTEREARQAAARIRARDFQWPDTAQKTIEQLMTAISSSPKVSKEFRQT